MQAFFERNEHKNIFYDTQGNNDCPIHYHQNVEIIQMLSGCIEITVRGKTKRLMPGEFAIASSYEPHGFLTVGESEFNVIVLPACIIGDYLTLTEEHMLASPFLETCTATEELTMFSEKLRAYSNRDTSLTSIGLANTLLGIFVEAIGLVKKTKFVHAETLLTEILFYINDHYLEEMSLDDIAKTLGYHKSYISTVFNQNVGYHFNHYVNMLRVRHAERLILNTKLSLDEISEKSGFKCTRTFRRAFMDYYNQAPNEYKRSHAQKKTKE